jgi:chromate transporter
MRRGHADLVVIERDQAVVAADVAAAIPLGRAALTNWVAAAITAGSMVLLLTTKIDTLWVILGAAILSLSASCLGLIGRI